MERYDDVVGEVDAVQRFTRVEAYDLIEVLGENRHREYKVCDSAISSKLDIEAPAQ